MHLVSYGSAAPEPSRNTDLQPEDRLWTGLSFPILSVGELAALRADLGHRVHFHHGVWWEQARPFFCLPCAPLARIPTHLARPSARYSLIGFSHLALPGAPSNGVRQMIVAENLSRYSLATLSRKRRFLVRRALSTLQVRPIDRLDDLLTDGFDIYASWHLRNGWGRHRSTRQDYVAWMSRACRQPKRLVLGAYHGNRLVAFCLAQAVGSLVDPTFIASHTDALPLLPNDALFHALLSIARQTAGIEAVDFGPVSAKSTLNSFKLHYASLKSFPSYTWMNPLVRLLLAPRIRHRYPWLHPPAAQDPAAFAAASKRSSS